jgi:hypothetical protein
VAGFILVLSAAVFRSAIRMDIDWKLNGRIDVEISSKRHSL